MNHSFLSNMKDIEVAPLRTLSDFLLESARFQIPNLKDHARWANRVRNNLLYYQTNYFLITLLMYLTFGLIYPVKLISGICAITIAYYICRYTIHERYIISLRKNHPFVNIFIFITGCYILADVLKDIIIIVIGIQFPIIFIFLHSSLRLRNVKNKINNQLETIGLRRTPMGVFLESIAANETEKIILKFVSKIFEGMSLFIKDEERDNSK